MAGMTAAVPDPRLSPGRAQEERRHIVPEQERLAFSLFILPHIRTSPRDHQAVVSLMQQAMLAAQAPCEEIFRTASHSELMPCSWQPFSHQALRGSWR